jgi:hypothetical protein
VAGSAQTRVRRLLGDLPLPAQYAAIGATFAGVAGAVTGLVLGLHAHVATAWAATVEVALPAAVLGGVLGVVLGAAVKWSRRGRPGH